MPVANRGGRPLAQSTRRSFQSDARNVTKISVSLPSCWQGEGIESPCGRSPTSPSATKQGTSQVSPTVRIQRGMKEVPLTPIARRQDTHRPVGSKRHVVCGSRQPLPHRVGFASPEQSENTQLHCCVNRRSQCDSPHVAHNSMRCARPHLRGKEAEAIAQTSSSHSTTSAGTAEIHAA